jgi:hypothetical protein
LPRLRRIQFSDPDARDGGIHIEGFRQGAHSLLAPIFGEHLQPEQSCRRKKWLHRLKHQGPRTQEAAHRPVCLDFPPAAIVAVRFFLVSVHVATENLVSGVAVLVEEVKRSVIEREQVRVEKSVASLMGDGCPDTSRSVLAAFGIQCCRNDNGFNAVLSEPGESQHAVWQILVLWGNIETLFDEAVDANRFR